LDQSSSPDRETEDPKSPRRRRPRTATTIAGMSLAAAIVAIGIGYWQVTEINREMLRISTEIAQLRVSLDLYARGRPANADTAETLAALADRLAVLEQAPSVPDAAPVAAAPALPAVTESGEDCLPPGMRLLVAMGDNYAICGQPASIEVGMVDDGYITLVDGTTIPSGGSMPLPQSACTVAVTSSGDEGLTGYAEIRVSC
jgi:hypothetical protein